MGIEDNKKIITKINGFIHNWINPIFDPLYAHATLKGYGWFLRDYFRYRKLPGAERIDFFDTLPIVHEKTSTTSIDAHYFYQDWWAMQLVKDNQTDLHVDVGSRAETIAHMSIFTNVTFLDIRPLKVGLKDLQSVAGSILSMPFEDNSIKSLSCLNVAEHICLGRYGDTLDPMGTKKAAAELARVLSLGGNLYFSVPIGQPRVYFNASRIHSVDNILNYFQGLRLVELSGITDANNFVRNISPSELRSSRDACGLFWFSKT